MPKPKKPSPVFEVVFEGVGVFPEQIPLGTLVQTFSAIRRLAAGAEIQEEEDDEECQDDGSIRLLDVVRGSAVFRFVGQTPASAITYLREAGKVLRNPDLVGEHDHILRPIERLSSTASRLQCSILVKESGKSSAVLARIEPDTFRSLTEGLFITGDTAFTGTVKRVGGPTEMRCALRVSFQSRMLFCKVATAEVARKLGDRLYQEVAVQGTAKWIKNTWRIAAFTIKDVHQPDQGSLRDAMEALRQAGGKGWDEIDDPDAFLHEVSGK